MNQFQSVVAALVFESFLHSKSKKIMARKLFAANSKSLTPSQIALCNKKAAEIQKSVNSRFFVAMPEGYGDESFFEFASIEECNKLIARIPGAYMPEKKDVALFLSMNCEP